MLSSLTCLIKKNVRRKFGTKVVHCYVLQCQTPRHFPPRRQLMGHPHPYARIRHTSLVLPARLDRVRNCFLGSLVNLLDQHLGLAQMRRMSRAAPFHMRFGARCNYLLILRRGSMVVLTDEVRGWDVAPGGAGQLRSLYTI